VPPNAGRGAFAGWRACETSPVQTPESTDLAKRRRRVKTAFETGDLTDLRGEDVMAAWTGSPFPEEEYGSDFWVRAFRHCHEWFNFSQGYEPLELFRGTAPPHEHGMAWTTDLSKAHDFAWGRLHAHYAPSEAERPSLAYVYRTQVSRDAIHCEVDLNFNLSGRHYEGEVIVEPGLLGEIECVETVLPGANRAKSSEGG